MDRRVFKTIFSDTNIGGWPCPRCQSGTLHLVNPDKKIQETTVDSDKEYEEYGDPEMLDISIAVSLECSDTKCKERVICLGNGSPSYGESWDETSKQYQPDFETIFRPTFFYPHLKMFKVLGEVPDSIRKHIFSSFQIFFCNPGSSLNCLRIALEEVLNFIGVKKITQKKKRKIRISLHDRIDSLDGELQEVKELCFAIKWHGNSGSHPNSEVTIDDVLDAYEIFEVIQEKIFDKKSKKAKDLAKKINKRKGVSKTKH